MGNVAAITMLSTRAAQYTPRGDGGKSAEFNWEDIAGALAKTPHVSSDLLRAMYCHDAASLRKVIARIRGGLMASDVPVQKQQQFSVLVVEVFAIPQYCPTCEGRGQHMAESVLYVCDDCGGSGFGKVTNDQLARRMAVSESEWLRLYDKEFNECFATLGRWSYEGVMELMRADEL